jgi:uncharacterized protein
LEKGFSVTSPQSELHYLPTRLLRVNVGFLLAEGAGFNRQISLDLGQPIRVAEDLILQSLLGELRLTRTTEGIWVQGSLESRYAEDCSRCLALVAVPLQLELEELFATIPGHEAQFRVGEDNFIDLAPLVREEALLAVPSKVSCRPDCRGLCPECGANWNDSTCQCHLQAKDSRWAALAKFPINRSD